MLNKCSFLYVFIENAFDLELYNYNIFEWKTYEKLYRNSLVSKWSTKDKYLLNKSLLRYVIEYYLSFLDAVETTFVSDDRCKCVLYHRSKITGWSCPFLK